MVRPSFSNLHLLVSWIGTRALMGVSLSVACACAHGQLADPGDAGVLSGTSRLESTGDIASDLVDGVDRFLLRQLDQSIALRQQAWPKPEAANATRDGYEQAIAPLRDRYRNCIGLVDPRVENPQWVVESAFDPSTSKQLGSPSVASFEGGSILQVRWPVCEGLEGQGLLVVPEKIRWSVVLVLDAGQMPEQLCGHGPNANTVALEFARQGALVVIPQVVSRQRESRNGRATMTDQEYLYRSAFVLGRHLLGHHVQQCLAAVDILKRSSPDEPIAVAGWGEGGWIALSAAAADPRIDGALVSGHFAPRETIWREPIHRNVQGLLEAFGDAQLAALVAPRVLVIDPVPGPAVDILGDGGAPGQLHGPDLADAHAEFLAAHRMATPWHVADSILWTEPETNPGEGRPSRTGVQQLMGALKLPYLEEGAPTSVKDSDPHWGALAAPELRRSELLSRWDRYQQRILDLAHRERELHWKNLDTSSKERFAETIEPYREEFRDRIIGRWDMEKKELNPRSRLIYDEAKWQGHEVVLDVFDDVIAYGILLVPKSDTPVRNRPCVVFQHGLEGRPNDTIVGDHPAYHNVSSRLADEGYVVFAPQNLYLFTDRFRTLQRKSNPLGKTLFSTIIAQHEQIVRWLGSRPEIDPERIAFYGLSYGGKSAMRIPALVPEYCLSICSADFNDWVWKNASTSSPYSYVWTMEYEIFEFGLGRTFNYSEMAALIAPRPFMVERGHFDGVAPDERVALEYAKVRNLYAARLGIPDKTRIEWFVGPHTIHGVGTFEFLQQHLRPK